AALHAALRVEPVGQHLGDDADVVHAVHDDAAELGLAEAALHVVVVQVQGVVVERGLAEVADGFAGRRERRAVDLLAGLEGFECGGGHGIFLGYGPCGHMGRMVQPRPAQMTSSRWLKNTLSCTANRRSFLMNLSSARACRRITSPGRAGVW